MIYFFIIIGLACDISILSEHMGTYQPHNRPSAIFKDICKIYPTIAIYYFSKKTTNSIVEHNGYFNKGKKQYENSRRTIVITCSRDRSDVVNIRFVLFLAYYYTILISRKLNYC